MTLAETVLKVLQEQLVPEIGTIKQTQVAIVARLESMERESLRRFELIDKHFELIDKRFEEGDHRLDGLDKRLDGLDRRIQEQGIEHARRMDVLDRRMERLEEKSDALSDRVAQVDHSVARLSLLGDHVRRVDEMAAEVRELRRRQDESERRIADPVLTRPPKT